jgi:hypothetical protein
VNSPLLFTAALLLSSAMTFAQQVNVHPPDLLTQQQVSQAFSTDAGRSLLATNPSFRLNGSVDPMMVTSDKRPIDDTVCYKIRSYVVARDRKDSDSVHPVGYSTCQPASKYRLRVTQMTAGSAQR